MDVDADATTANDNAAAAAAASQGDIGPGTTIRKMYDGVWYPGKVEEVSAAAAVMHVLLSQRCSQFIVHLIVAIDVCAQHLRLLHC
jgi:hypothetical protein